MKYAVIIDAGSSGSRAFVYTWPDPDSYLKGLPSDSILRQALLPIETTQLWVNKVQPGISSYSGKASKIWKNHLQPLLKRTQEVVPWDQQKETPIYFLATAGLRLLEDNDRNEILEEVCHLLRRKTRFAVPECGTHVTMIDGQTEGLYGWLGLNYLVHWSMSKNWRDFSDTYGFLDMGGASAQLAFASSADSNHKNDLHTVRIRTAAGDPVEWHVFVTTWLGFGANQARSRFRDQLISELSAEEIAEYENNGAPIPVIDPCLPTGATEVSDTFSNKHCIFQGSGQWNECERRIESLLNAGVPCSDEPCLFDGVHVPDFNLSDGKYVGVSEYWYTLQDLFQHNGKFDYRTLESKVSAFCGSDWQDIEARIANGDFTKADGSQLSKEDIEKACFKSAWVLTILSKGFNFPLSPENPSLNHNFRDTFQSAMEIEGTEISWTLGRAVLHAASQITPSSGNENALVGISTHDGHFLNGGDPYLLDKNSHMHQGGHASRIVVWLLALFIIVAAILKLTPLGTRLGKLRIVKRLRRSVESVLGGRYQSNSFGNIGYGNVYPHAGIPLSTFDSYIHEGMSTSRPPMRAPSRVESRTSLANYED